MEIAANHLVCRNEAYRPIKRRLMHVGIAKANIFKRSTIYIYTLYLTTLAPTTTKVDFHGGRPYKK